jgi:hypothetical protein
VGGVLPEAFVRVTFFVLVGLFFLAIGE